MKNLLLIIGFAMIMTSCTYHHYYSTGPNPNDQQNYPQGYPQGQQIPQGIPQAEYTPAIDGFNTEGYGFLDSEPYSNIVWNCWQEHTGRWFTNPITRLQEEEVIENCNQPTGKKGIFHVRIPTPLGILATTVDYYPLDRNDGDTPIIEALYDNHTKKLKHALPMKVRFIYYQGKYWMRRF